MIISGCSLSCSLDGLTPLSREEQRIAAIRLLDLLNISSVPVLDEATQMVARFLASPISIITLMVNQEVSIKAAFGLSSLGLLNSLSTHRTIARNEAFCTYVVDSQQPFAIEDTLNDSVLSQSILVQKYKIRSYLGVPLIFQNQCIGTLAVMSLSPFAYSQNSLEYLLLVSRWCLQEIEMGHLKKTISLQSSKNYFNLDTTKHLQVLHQFGEELRNPLTSIVGMTSILVQGVLGTMTSRQEEYLNIIYSSSQHINILLDELLNLINLPRQDNGTKLTLVNLEMLCQKVIQGVTPLANRKLQTLHCYTNNLDLILLLNRPTIYQALCYLIFVVLILSPSESTININLSCSKQKAVIFIDFPSLKLDNLSSENNNHNAESAFSLNAGIDLSQSLILSHGGTLMHEKGLKISDTSYERYIISLPKLHCQ